MKGTCLRLTLLLLLAVFPHGIAAQSSTSGGLAGVITDPSDAVVPDAVVRIADDAKGTIQEVKTDREGVYRFFFLAPGIYTLTVTRDGFRQESRAVNILLGPPGTVNLTLEIAKASTEVKVTAEAPFFQAENGDISTTMNELQVSHVPNPGNDLTYIAQTAPGAIMNTDTIGAPYVGNFSILGMPGTSNLFTLNGMNDNDPGSNTNNSGVMGMLLGQNEIQEATIVTNGYSGQFGGAAGANVNYLTKSGSNTFHGNAEWFWNGRALNANDWIDNASGQPRVFAIANQWAGSLGGPIKRDKLFFFIDTEGLRILLPTSAQVVIPSPQFESATIANIDSISRSTSGGLTSASHNFYEQMFNLYNSAPGASSATPGNFDTRDPTGCSGFKDPSFDPTAPCAVHFLKNFSQPSSESLLSGRVDWNIGASDRAFLLVQYDHGQNPVFVDAISPLFDATATQPWWQGQLLETHAIGPATANQLLLAGSYSNYGKGVANPAKALAAFPTTLNWFNSGLPFAPLGGLDYLYALPSGQKTIQYQISDDFIKTHNQHKFGFGVSFLRTYQIGGGYNPNGGGQLLPQTMRAFFYGGVGSDPNADFTTLTQRFPLVTRNHFGFYSLGFYAQDEWHARSNLTLTLAIRADHQSNPVCRERCFARLAGPFDQINHDLNQPYNQAILVNHAQGYPNTDSMVWAPRFGFAWQPLGVSRHTVLRGGAGYFYDPVPGVISLGFFAYNPPLVNQFSITGHSLAPDEQNSLSQIAAASNTAFSNGFASGQTFAQIQKSVPFFKPPLVQTPPITTHSPKYLKWSLQAQQTFGTGTSLSIGYFGNRGSHEFVQNPNANAFGFGSFAAQTAACASPPVPPCWDSRFGMVDQFGTDAVSNYQGMVVSFEHRFARWGQGQFQVNYTYGHALDEVSNGGVAYFTYASSNVPQDASNLRGSYGPADYDVRHSLNANYVWQIPVKAALRGRGSDDLVGGWQVSGTIFARTAFPYTVLDTNEAGNLGPNNFGGVIYAVPVAPFGPGTPCGEGAVYPSSPQPCQPPQVLGDGSPNPGALFVQTGRETGFNTGCLVSLDSKGMCPAGSLVSFAQGRNRFRGPSYFDADFAIMKDTKIPRWKNAVLGIGFQFFNVLNHPNFGTPNNSSSGSFFGQITYQEQVPTSILGSGTNINVSARMIQSKIRLQF